MILAIVMVVNADDDELNNTNHRVPTVPFDGDYLYTTNGSVYKIVGRAWTLTKDNRWLLQIDIEKE